MLRPYEAMAAVRMELPSDLEMMDEVVETATRLAFGQAIAPTDPFALVLRELLENAMVHGNGNDPAREVRLAIDRVSIAMLRITVEDQGAGFDYRSLVQSGEESGDNDPAGGYAFIRRHCPRVEFSESGSRVTAYFFMDGKGRLESQWTARIGLDNHGRVD